MTELINDHIEAVLFDHNDTLVGTIKPKFEQFKHVARTWYNKELTDDELRLHWGKPLSILQGILYETTDLELAMERVLSIHHLFPKRLFTDTISTLQTLHDEDKKIGVVSAVSRVSFEYDLKELGIPGDLLDYTQTEEATNFHKPNPQVFIPAKIWLRSLDILPRQILYVGDGLNDYHAATGAGFDFIGVETGLITHDQFVEAGAVSVASLAKLISV